MIELELICIVLDFYFNFFKFIMNENIIEKKFIWVDNPTSRMGLVGPRRKDLIIWICLDLDYQKKGFIATSP